MKKILFVLICFSMSLGMFAQAPKHNQEWVNQHYDRSEVMIPMRDGVKLFTVIYEPKDKSVKHPIIMQRTCYGVSRSSITSTSYEPYADAGYIFVYQDVRGKNMSEGEFEDIRPFKENKKLNKKAAKNVGQTDEASDTYDTAEWLVKNTNNNGCIGQYGISYPGFYTTMAALSGHPAIKAVSPQAPVTDWYHGDDVHHNGAFMMAEMISFQPMFEYMMNNKLVRAQAEAQARGERPAMNLKFPTLFHNDFYTDYLKIGTYKNITEAYGDSLEYLRIVREHPNWDEYWESHTVTKGHMHDVKPAVMVVGGLFDKEDCYGAFDVYKAIKEQSPETDLYIVEGPWFHGGWARGQNLFWNNLCIGEQATSDYYIHNIEYPFFAYYLEGKGEKPSHQARIYDTGKREWSYYTSWPEVKVADTTPFYLHPCGKVSTKAPDKDGVVSYVSDPANPVPYHNEIETSTSRNYMIDDQRYISNRPDVVTWSTEVLTEDLTLKGEVEFDLQVDLSSTDADFIVKIIDVYPDDFSWYKELGIQQPNRGGFPGGPTPAPQQAQQPGVRIPNYPMAGYQLMVRGEVMRGKFRESFSEPKAFEPGKTTLVKFTAPDVSHTFKKGHKLMISVQSTWFPLVDRNPQTFCDIYTCDESAYVKEIINIHCDKNAPSIIKLPVVK